MVKIQLIKTCLLVSERLWYLIRTGIKLEFLSTIKLAGISQGFRLKSDAARNVRLFDM